MDCNFKSAAPLLSMSCMRRQCMPRWDVHDDYSCRRPSAYIGLTALPPHLITAAGVQPAADSVAYALIGVLVCRAASAVPPAPCRTTRWTRPPQHHLHQEQHGQTRQALRQDTAQVRKACCWVARATCACVFYQHGAVRPQQPRHTLITPCKCTRTWL